MNTDKLRKDIELQNDFIKTFPLDATDFSEQYQEIFAWFIGKKNRFLEEQEAGLHKDIFMYLYSKYQEKPDMGTIELLGYLQNYKSFGSHIK